MKNIISMLALASVSITLVGCATHQHKSLYGWGSYQEQVYKRFKAEGSPEEQIASLEEGLQKMSAANESAPPGYHAHLGMLYAETGRDSQMVQELNAEKTLFPESASYMDFLMRKYKN